MIHRLFFLRNAFCVLGMFLLAGCSHNTDERLSNLESRMTGMQVLDLRMDRLEEKVSLLEQDMGHVKSVVASDDKKKNARSGTKKTQQAGKKISPSAQQSGTELPDAQRPDSVAVQGSPGSSGTEKVAQPVSIGVKKPSEGTTSSAGNSGQTAPSVEVSPATTESRPPAEDKAGAALAEGQTKDTAVAGTTGLNAVKNHAEPRERNSRRHNTPVQAENGKTPIIATPAERNAATASSSGNAEAGADSPWMASGMDSPSVSGDAAAPQKTADSTQPVAQPVATATPSPAQSGNPVTAAVAQPENTATPPAGQTAAAQPKQTKAAKNKGKSAYDNALALYNSKKLDQSLWAFQAFVRDYPDSSLVPNALYWSGECRYASGSYAEAIMEFKNLVTKYPADNKTSAALLKIGYSYLQLQDVENAKFYLEILLEDFPRSAPAKLARQRLASLK